MNRFLIILFCFLLVNTSLEGQGADLVLLDGQTETVEVKSIDQKSMTIVSKQGERKVELSELLSVDFAKSENVGTAPYSITLRDGSNFGCNEIEMTPRKLKIKSDIFKSVSLPTISVSNILLQPIDEVVAEKWNELLTRKHTADAVIIRKADVLDRVRAVVGEIKENKIQLILDKREVSVPIEKIFGVIYATREEENLPEAICKATFADQRNLMFKKLKLANGLWKGDLLQGGSAKFQTSHLRRLDFSQGKIVYLSDIEPAKLKYSPFWGDFTWKYHRDQNVDGKKLRLGNEEYEKGLWIHSKTELSYRLAKKYNRFQATVGIDEAIAAEIRSKSVGTVDLLIRGDGRELFKEKVGPKDKPRELDLNISNILNLEIIVDYADDLDISDHLVLGNARVVK